METKSKALHKMNTSFDATQKDLTNLTLDHLNKAPLKEGEDQTKLTRSELAEDNIHVVKPERQVHGQDKPNPKFEKERKKGWEMVKCFFENREVEGEQIECWSKPFAGDPASFWKLPVNRTVMAPRHLVKQLENCRYHKMRMEEKTVSSDGAGVYYGALVADYTVNRLLAREV